MIFVNSFPSRLCAKLALIMCVKEGEKKVGAGGIEMAPSREVDPGYIRQGWVLEVTRGIADSERRRGAYSQPGCRRAVWKRLGCLVGRNVK